MHPSEKAQSKHTLHEDGVSCERSPGEWARGSPQVSLGPPTPDDSRCLTWVGPDSSKYPAWTSIQVSRRRTEAQEPGARHRLDRREEAAVGHREQGFRGQGHRVAGGGGDSALEKHLQALLRRRRSTAVPSWPAASSQQSRDPAVPDTASHAPHAHTTMAAGS